MSSGLELAAAIAGLASLTIEVVKLTYDYVSGIQNADGASRTVRTALESLLDVLLTMESSLKAHPLSINPSLLSETRLNTCKARLSALMQRLEGQRRPDGLLKKRHHLTWPFEKSETRELLADLKSFIDAFHAGLTLDSRAFTVETHRNLKDMKDEKYFQNVLNWLLPEHTSSLRFTKFNEHWLGTENWLIDEPKFKEWLQSDIASLLWCNGPPGCGKTVHMARLLRNLEAEQAAVNVIPLCHFFEHQDPITHHLEFLVRSLLKQYVTHERSVPSKIEDLYSSSKAGQLGASLDSTVLQNTLIDICARDKRPVIVLDALDECPERMRKLVIQFSLSLMTQGIRVLFASRSLPDIYQKVPDAKVIEMAAREEDLRVYVTGRLQELEAVVDEDPTIATKICTTIIQKSQGVFLFARLTMDCLANAMTLRDLEELLEQDSWNLENMYQQTWYRLSSQEHRLSQLAKRALIWVCYSQRPLHTKELQHALAVRDSDTFLNCKGLPNLARLITICMGLLQVDNDDTCRLFHATAYEFLASNLEFKDTKQLHLSISSTCLTYLSFPPMRAGRCADWESFKKRLDVYSLADYAAKFWADHVLEVGEGAEGRARSFLLDDNLRDAFTQLFYHRERKDQELQLKTFETLPTGQSALQIACGLGLVEVARELIQQGADVCQADDQGWTPLISASSHGRLEILDIILNETDSKSLQEQPGLPNAEGQGWISWFWAVIKSQLRIAKYHQSDSRRPKHHTGLNKVDDQGWSPLFWAVLKSQFETSRRLLPAGADAKLEDHDRWTPMHWAAYKGDTDMVKLLLEFEPARKEPASMSYRGNYRVFGPLFVAAERQNSHIVDDLLRFHDWKPPRQAKIPVKSLIRVTEKVDPLARASFISSKDFSASLLNEAIQSDQLMMVKLLVESGAELGPLRDERDRRSPLHLAMFCGDFRIPQFLLSSGGDMSIRDKKGYSALDLAASSGVFSILKMMLQQPNQDAVRGGRTSPLHLIWRSKISYEQKVEIADMLLSLGADINRLDYHGFTPFQYALTRGRFDAIDWFTTHGIDVNVYEGKPEPVLHCTITTMDWLQFFGDRSIPYITEKQVIEGMRKLLAHGAPTNSRDGRGRTPLHAAAYLCLPEVCRFLVQHGADVEASAEHNILPLHLAVNKNHSCSCSDTTRGEVLDCLLPLMSPSALSSAHKPTTYYSELYPPGVQATALSGAINSRFYRAAETLHQHGAALGDARSISRRFAEEVCWRNDDVVASLLRYGADPTHLPDAPARPLLLVAARAVAGTPESRCKILAALVQAGADVNAADEESGATALHAALENRECVGAVEVLLAHGADVSRRDKEGRTALDKARMAGLEDVTALLEEELKKL